MVLVLEDEQESVDCMIRDVVLINEDARPTCKKAVSGLKLVYRRT